MATGVAVGLVVSPGKPDVVRRTRRAACKKDREGVTKKPSRVVLTLPEGAGNTTTYPSDDHLTPETPP